MRALSGSLLAGLFGQAAVVVTGILTARSLGPTDRGYWALLLLLPAVLQQLGTLGLQLGLTYRLATHPREERETIRLVRVPVAAQAVVLSGIHAAALAWLLHGEESNVTRAGILSLLLISGSIADIYGKAILQGQARYTALNLTRMLTAGLSLVGIVAIYVAERATLVSVAAVWVLANLCAGVVTLGIAMRHRGGADAAQPGALRSMFAFGLRGFLGTMSPVDTFRLDQAAIGLVLPPSELGLYVTAVAFTNLPALVARSIGLVALPEVARSSHGSGGAAVWRFFAISTAALALTVGLLIIIAGELVPFLFGDDFGEAVTMTRILLAGSFFYSLRRVLADSASGAGAPSLGSLAELVSWAILIPGVALAVGPFGAEGVATVMAFAAAASFFALAAMILNWRYGLRESRELPEPPRKANEEVE